MRRYRVPVIVMIACIAFMSVFIMDPDKAAYAKTQTFNVGGAELENGRFLTFDNMPYNSDHSIIRYFKGKQLDLSGIQNFDFTPDGKYVLNTHDTNYVSSPKKVHTMITRCVRPAGSSAATAGPVARCVDATVLENYGHSDVLCVTQPDLRKQVYNLWIGCTPATKGKAYATEIARVTYVVGSNNRARITKIVKIKGFRKGNVVKKKAAYFKKKAKVDRVSCAADTASNQMVFRLKLQSGYGVVYISYDFRKLDAALNKVKNNGKYNITKAAKWQKAHVRCSLTPLNSLQSFDVDGNRLYLCGGHFGIGSQVYVLNYKIQKNGKAKEQYKSKMKSIEKVINVEPRMTVRGTVLTRSGLEVEGMKVAKNGYRMKYYLNYLFRGGGLVDGSCILSFTR